MDHHEEQDPDRLPQQEQQQIPRINQPPSGRNPPQTLQNQQWLQQRSQVYPIAQLQQQQQQQQPSLQQAYGRIHPFTVGGSVPGGPQPGDMATATTAEPQAPPQQDYQQRMNYAPPLHQAHQTAGPHYSGSVYPQHYAQPPLYHHQQMAIQQSLHMQQHMTQGGITLMEHHGHPPSQGPPIPQPYVQPTVGRLPSDRPLVKLSVSLIDTYKHINKIYYEERDARRAARAAQKSQKGGQGSYNNGWDDENYDYIVTNGEMFYGRYLIKERIGKGSFGQVVRAVDTETQKDVAIKIIKSKKPFLMQAKTEIELLAHLCEKDPEDQNNIVRLLTHFMFRNHQCLVFEMLSLNLYELLKNTQFGGVSLNLIRKFAKQILKALSFLARTDVDIIHCDLKPENILLRHPKRSGVKVIDFGSSCRSNKRMYSYIQSRFYRSPEVMLGLPYSVAIDMWSLGCILAEMHTGEPLFSGSDQFDQMQKIVKLLGMVPVHMIERAGDQQRTQFFERGRTPAGSDEWVIKQVNISGSSGEKSSSGSTTSSKTKQMIVPSDNPVESLTEVICSEGNKKKRLPSAEGGDSQKNYELFVDLIYKMLAYDPEDRIKPEDALTHPFIRSGEQSQSSSPYPGSQASSTEGGANVPRRKDPTQAQPRNQQPR